MSELKKKYLRISKGQISKQLIERTDIGILDSSGQELTNWYNSKYGAIKTSSGTVLKYSFGSSKKIKLQSIILSDGNQGVFAFNGTDHTMCIFDENGNLLSNVAIFTPATETNIDELQLAQNEDLILVCTGDNPIMQIDISSMGNLTYSVFDIPMKDILKTSVMTAGTLNPKLFRYFGSSISEITDATALGIEVGDYVIVSNSTSWTPPTTATSCYQLTTAPATFSSATYTPANLDACKDLNTNKYYRFTSGTLAYRYGWRGVESHTLYAWDCFWHVTGYSTSTYTSNITVYTTSSSPSVNDIAYIIDSNGKILTGYKISSISGNTIQINQKLYHFLCTSPTSIIFGINFLSIQPQVGEYGVYDDGTSGISDKLFTSYSSLAGLRQTATVTSVVSSTKVNATFNGQSVEFTYTDVVSFSLQATRDSSKDKTISTDNTAYTEDSTVEVNDIIKIKENGAFTKDGVVTTTPRILYCFKNNDDSTDRIYTESASQTPYNIKVFNSSGTRLYDRYTNLGTFITKVTASTSIVYSRYADGDITLNNGIITKIHNSTSWYAWKGTGVSNIVVYTKTSTAGASQTLYDMDKNEITPLALANMALGDNYVRAVFQGTESTYGFGLSAWNTTSGNAQYTWQRYTDGDEISYSPVNFNRDSTIDVDDSYWAEESVLGEDISLAGTYTPSATTGVLSITLNNANFQMTAPTGLTPKNYAESILCGVQFDGGDDGVGVGKIIGITGTTSGQVYTITKLQIITEITFAGTSSYSGAKILTSQGASFSGNYPLTESNPLSSTNYPTSIFFYQQRLVIAGTINNGSQMLFSTLGKYDNFIDEGYSSSAFQLIIGSTQKETIKRVLVNQGIQIFTNVSEWLMNDQSITRSSGFIRNSQMGTNGVQPVISANGTTLFVPKNGKGIISFIYNYQSASYMTPYISLFTDVLDTPIVDLCLKRGLDSQDDTLLFCSLSDGSLVIGNYLQEHDIQAFCVRKSSSALYKQTIQAESNILLLLDRNGITSLELADTTKYSVCSYNNYTYDSSTGAITNLPSQYNGLSVNVYDNNKAFVESVSVSNNTATLSVATKPTSLGEIGFNIHSTFISNPINISASTFDMYKSIQSIKIALTEESKSDYLKVCDKSGWLKGEFRTYIRPVRPKRKCQFTIENDIYPCEILSIELTLEY